MANDTREQFLDTAEALFAERGFYGVSIAAIADELGLTKQALLHHFGSKEKLYGEVLKRISESFVRKGYSPIPDEDPAEALKGFLMTLATRPNGGSVRTQLLMRELLDNKRRAETAGTWYLKGFLNWLIDCVRAIPAWRDASRAEALALVYQLLGAINYYGVSEPTLRGIFGDAQFEELDAAFPAQLERLITTALKGEQANHQ